MDFDTFMYEHPVIILLGLVACCAAGWFIADAQWNSDSRGSEKWED